MRFEEAEQKYRELEASLVSGELKEDDFLIEVGQLRVVDQEGRRWMLSARTGRWMVHDGQQWVFAEHPEEQPEPEPPAVTLQGPSTTAAAPVAPTQAQPPKAPARRTATPRMMTAGIAALILVACVIGGGISAWVFFLRGWGDITPMPAAPTQVGFVRTYTPRPATPTYTPTFTPTPSRTPSPTLTPVATNTPLPTDTPAATNTPYTTNTPTPTWTPLVLSVTEQATTAMPEATTVAAVTTESPGATATTATPVAATPTDRKSVV